MAVHDEATRLAVAEVEYWNQRAGEEFWYGLDGMYSRDFPALDLWGMYGYMDYLRALPTDSPILEVGAGTVAKATFLSRYSGFSAITVTDLAVRQMALNRTFCRSHDLPDRHAAADFHALPFRDGAFAAVFVHSALHHTPDPEAVIGEMARCLRPGGLLVVGHEPSRPAHRLIRWAADGLRLSEKHHADHHSEADDELVGLDVGELREVLRARGVAPIAYLPHWYGMTVLHPLPLVVERVSGWKIDTPSWLRAVVRTADRIIANVPVVNRAGSCFSLVGRKAG